MLDILTKLTLSYAKSTILWEKPSSKKLKPFWLPLAILICQLTKRKFCVKLQGNQSRLGPLSIYRGSKYIFISRVPWARICVRFSVTNHVAATRVILIAYFLNGISLYLLYVKVNFGPQRLILLNSLSYFVLNVKKFIFLVVK